MNKLYYLALLCLLSLSTACSSGKKAFEHGNYYEATMKAVDRLRRSPNHNRSADILAQSYPMAVSLLETEIDQMKASSHPFRWRETVRRYELLNSLGDAIRRSPGALQVIPNPRDYHRPLREAKQLAAEESYQAGLKALALNTREGGREAHQHFSNVLGFVSHYRDTPQKIEEALEMATLKVVLDQIPVPGRYKVDVDFFQDQVESFLHSQHKGNPYVRFYTPREAKASGLAQADHRLRIQFDEFVIGETHQREYVEELSRDSVKVGEVQVAPDSLLPVYSTVKAKLHRFRKEVVSRGRVSMFVEDARTGAVLRHHNFPGEFVWFSEWGYYQGDERALNPDQLKMCGGKELPPPPPQDMFAGFSRPLFDQLVSACRSFYAGY
jgi:hypothetical protein